MPLTAWPSHADVFTHHDKESTMHPMLPVEPQDVREGDHLTISPPGTPEPMDIAVTHITPDSILGRPLGGEGQVRVLTQTSDWARRNVRLISPHSPTLALTLAHAERLITTSPQWRSAQRELRHVGALATQDADAQRDEEIRRALTYAMRQIALGFFRTPRVLLEAAQGLVLHTVGALTPDEPGRALLEVAMAEGGFLGPYRIPSWVNSGKLLITQGLASDPTLVGVMPDPGLTAGLGSKIREHFDLPLIAPVHHRRLELSEVGEYK